MKLTLILLTVAALSGWNLYGEDALPDHQLSEWKLGKLLSGEEVDLSKLSGKVVAIDFWGTH